MQLILEIESGPAAARKVVVSPDRAFYVGRTETEFLGIPNDWDMSNSHFALEWRSKVWVVRDLGSRTGTFVNGQKVSSAELKQGDKITAGGSTFVVRFDGQAVTGVPAAPVAAPVPRAAPAVAPSPAGQKPAEVSARPLIEVMMAQPEPLYAILDAARDPMIYQLMQGCEEEHQSLYEGTKGEELALVAPYLVRLPSGSPFLETLIEKGWGKSWGVYLTSLAPFAELRKHLRKFLTVQKETGGTLYFRYYDPRVLRIFLPTCNEEEWSQFFGPIARYLMEQDQPSRLLYFRREGSRLAQAQILLVTFR
jgi:pSer/pThr/pTyr-binding forkhead associated (FHA) protein